MTDFPQIVVGTYEEFVLGFQPQKIKLEGRKIKFHQTFVTHSHQASVRCTSANHKLMASSGADEYINIYDMLQMKISKVINYHDATVNCLLFTPDGSHLITANQKGDIAIFRCKDWNLVKLWKEAHKGANGVTSMSIHPTGSLLITTGSDNILRFWNLIKGRQAYATNYSKTLMGSSLNFGIWSSTGKYYLVGIGRQAEIYKTQTAAVIYKILMNSKITCATFCKNTFICLGNEEGNLEIHSLVHKKLLTQEQAHKARIKCITSFSKVNVKNSENKPNTYLVTADSLGVIKLWHVKKKGIRCILSQKAEVNCDCRITCLSIVPKIEENSQDVSEKFSQKLHDEVHQENNKQPDLSSSIVKNDSLVNNSINQNQKNDINSPVTSEKSVNTQLASSKNVNNETTNNVFKCKRKLGELSKLPTKKKSKV